MNNVVKLFVVASLGIGIFGGGGFVAYRLFFKKPDLRPGETNQPVVTPTPDPGIMMLEQAKRELDGGNKSNAEKILLSLIQDFPESAKVGDATVSGTFICTERQPALQFTVPAIVTLSLPGTPAGSTTGGGILGVSSTVTNSFKAPNIDIGVFSSSVGSIKSLSYQ